MSYLCDVSIKEVSGNLLILILKKKGWQEWLKKKRMSFDALSITDIFPYKRMHDNKRLLSNQ
jgi:hypothetical protein